MYSKESEYPSVTEILSPYSGYDQIPPAVLEAAAERGTLVHSHCEAIAKDIWAPAPKIELRGYVQSFQKWFDLFVDEVLLVEVELEDHDLGYCGHPDLAVRSSSLGGKLLLDLKTPEQLHRKIWGSQLSGYERLVRPRFKVDRIGSLRLRKDGKMARFDEFTDNRVSYFAAFYGALIAHKFFN